MSRSWEEFLFLRVPFLRCSNSLPAVVEAEVLHVSDGIPDGSSSTIQTGCNYGSGDHGLAPGLSWSPWTLRRRPSSCTSERVETVKYIKLPLPSGSSRFSCIRLFSCVSRSKHNATCTLLFQFYLVISTTRHALLLKLASLSAWNRKLPLASSCALRDQCMLHAVNYACIYTLSDSIDRFHLDTRNLFANGLNFRSPCTRVAD